MCTQINYHALSTNEPRDCGCKNQSAHKDVFFPEKTLSKLSSKHRGWLERHTVVLCSSVGAQGRRVSLSSKPTSTVVHSEFKGQSAPQ